MILANVSQPPKPARRGAYSRCIYRDARRAERRRSSTRCANFLKRAATSRLPKGGHAPSGRVQQYSWRAQTGRRHAAPDIGQRGGAAQPGPSRLQPGQYRPFRPGAAALCPFHLADPALCRPAGPSRAHQGARRRAGRPARRVGFAPAFAEIGAHISATERRAAQAERDVVDRYTAAYLAGQVGASFAGRISGVTRFGLFVKLLETGADGFIPARLIGDEYFRFDEARRAFIGNSETPPAWRPSHRRTGRGRARRRRLAFQACAPCERNAPKGWTQAARSAEIST
jgi:hypothetical protein